MFIIYYDASTAIEAKSQGPFPEKESASELTADSIARNWLII